LEFEARKMAKKTPRLSKKAMLNIFSKPATENYPFVKPKLPEDYRGQPVFDSQLCISCGLCSRNCPANAIEMVDVNGKKYPQVNLGRCIFCYTCAEGCPKKAITRSDVFELATTDKTSLIMKPLLIA